MTFRVNASKSSIVSSTIAASLFLASRNRVCASDRMCLLVDISNASTRKESSLGVKAAVGVGIAVDAEVEEVVEEVVEDVVEDAAAAAAALRSSTNDESGGGM